MLTIFQTLSLLILLPAAKSDPLSILLEKNASHSKFVPRKQNFTERLQEPRIHRSLTLLVALILLVAKSDPPPALHYVLALILRVNR
jgi:hypothetical protein